MTVKKTIVAVIPRSHATRNLHFLRVFAKRDWVPHPVLSAFCEGSGFREEWGFSFA